MAPGCQAREYWSVAEERVQTVAELGEPVVRRGVERRPVVLLAAAVSFVGVFVLCQLDEDPRDGLALLYVVPVALTALELGIVAGLLAGALATGLTAFWAATTADGLGLLGLATRAVVFFSVGAISGRFADRMRGAQRRQHALLRSGVELARLDQGDDLAAMVARHAAEIAAVRGVRVRLGDLEVVEKRAPGPDALRLPIATRHRSEGTLEVELRSPGVIADEERAALAALALQASVALENRTLLEREREHAKLQADLSEARRALEERAQQLRGVLETHEQERREVAHELREEAAQVLSAVLLGLHLVERDLEAAQRTGQLAELREHVDQTMGSLSEIAVMLRPPVLDGLGLEVALERLAGSSRAPELERIVAHLGDATSELDPELETAVYRVVEDAVRSMTGRRQARVSEERGELRVVVEPLGSDGEVRDLTVLRARLSLMGGRVDVEDGALVVTMPLPRAHADA